MGRRSELDLDVHSTGKVELHESIDGLGRRAINIDDASMGPRFKVLA
jgi:hypothetical protein